MRLAIVKSSSAYSTCTPLPRAGLAVGLLVGSWVGMVVGAAVGAAVGAEEGSTVGACGAVTTPNPPTATGVYMTFVY